MDERTRKLAIAATAVSLFIGFIFLTRWTGSDTETVESLDGQEMLDLENFCWALSMETIPYEDIIRSAVGLTSSDGTDIPQFDTPAGRNFAQSVIVGFVDGLPERYSDNGELIAEGLNKAIEGDLEPDEIDPYLDAFDDLQRDAKEDCVDADIGVFDEEGDPVFQDDGGYYQDDGGPFGSETTETTTFP